MASKKAINKSKGQVQVSKGTGQGRYAYGNVAPSLATLTRLPLAVPINGKGKGQFIHDLLLAAGIKGVTWPAIQQALTAKYGSAPKKRAVLYALLSGLQWHKTTGEKGIVTYHLGKARRKGS